MKNKVLINLSVPELSVEYDLFIPVNEVVWKVKILLLRSIEDMTNIKSKNNLQFYLINKQTGKIYDNNELIIETDIRNGTELLLISSAKSI